jgi:hypothetical protein
MKAHHLLIVVAMLVTPWMAHAADAPSETGKASSGRWQIHPVVNGMSMKGGKPDSRSENTMLLDTETGRTWILWPTKDTQSGWSWNELVQRKDTPKGPKAE